MPTTGLEVFDSTLQKTHIWLNDLRQLGGWELSHDAYRALRATLHALRDRLTVEEVAHLGGQLPMLVRGFYYEGWDPTDKPLRERHREQFLAQIERELADDPELFDPELVAQAVFAMLEQRVSLGEIQDVRNVLPRAIRDLWPGGADLA